MSVEFTVFDQAVRKHDLGAVCAALIAIVTQGIQKRDCHKMYCLHCSLNKLSGPFVYQHTGASTN